MAPGVPGGPRGPAGCVRHHHGAERRRCALGSAAGVGSGARAGAVRARHRAGPVDGAHRGRAGGAGLRLRAAPATHRLGHPGRAGQQVAGGDRHPGLQRPHCSSELDRPGHRPAGHGPSPGAGRPRRAVGDRLAPWRGCHRAAGTDCCGHPAALRCCVRARPFPATAARPDVLPHRRHRARRTVHQDLRRGLPRAQRRGPQFEPGGRVSRRARPHHGLHPRADGHRRLAVHSGGGPAVHARGDRRRRCGVRDNAARHHVHADVRSGPRSRVPAELQCRPPHPGSRAPGGHPAAQGRAAPGAGLEAGRCRGRRRPRRTQRPRTHRPRNAPAGHRRRARRSDPHGLRALRPPAPGHPAAAARRGQPEPAG